MPEVGQKSGRTLVWMAREDEVAFGEKLARALENRATWTAIAPGLHQGAESPRLGEVLQRWGDGARLRLRNGGPIIQYLGGFLRGPDNALVPTATHGGSLSSGELAYRWSPSESSSEEREAFEALVATTLRILRENTLPNRVVQNGKPYRSGRIGRAALELARASSLTLIDTSCRTARLELRSAS